MNILPTELILDILKNISTINDIKSFCNTSKRNLSICNKFSKEISSNIINKLIAPNLLPDQFKGLERKMIKEIWDKDIYYYTTPTHESRTKSYDFYENERFYFEEYPEFDEMGDDIENTNINKLFTFLWEQDLKHFRKIFKQFRIEIYGTFDGYSFHIKIMNRDQPNITNLKNLIKTNFNNFKIIEEYADTDDIYIMVIERIFK